MLAFSSFSIRKKIFIILFSISVITLMMGCFLSFYVRDTTTKKDFKQQTLNEVSLLSSYFSPIVIYEKTIDNTIITEKLQSVKGICYTTIYNADKQILYQYSKQFEKMKFTHTFSTKTIIIFKSNSAYATIPIVHNSTVKGWIEIVFESNPPAVYLQNIFLLIALSIVILCGLLYVGMKILHRHITKPLIELVKFIDEVKTRGFYLTHSNT